MEKHQDSSWKLLRLRASREGVRALSVATLLLHFGVRTQGNHLLQEPIPIGTYQNSYRNLSKFYRNLSKFRQELTKIPAENQCDSSWRLLCVGALREGVGALGAAALTFDLGLQIAKFHQIENFNTPNTTGIQPSSSIHLHVYSYLSNLHVFFHCY